MARQIGVGLDDQLVYRALIFKLYSGIHNMDLKTYTTADGTEYQYHKVEAFGPYGTRGPATAQVTSAINDHQHSLLNGRYFNTQALIPQITGIVEQQLPQWQMVAGSERTP
jgi:hypothetical protein